MKAASKSEAPKNIEELVRANVVARRYDVSERCVFLWAEKGIIPCIRIGKTVRFDLKAVITKLEGGES